MGNQVSTKPHEQTKRMQIDLQNKSHSFLKYKLVPTNPIVPCKCVCLQAHSKQAARCPFNARAGQYDGRHFYHHISPAAGARELFKPSTDSECLLVSVAKKVYSIELRVTWDDVTREAVFEFLSNFIWRGRQPNQPFFDACFFLKTRLKSPFFEPLIGFPGYCNQNYCSKKQFCTKIKKSHRM